MKILVTGATGFVGRPLCRHLAQRDVEVRAAVRREVAIPHAAELAIVGDIGPDTDWSAALEGVDTVVHLAARVHLLGDRAPNPLSKFRHVNVLGSEQLARAAARAGVRRLVFASSAKVMGERTHQGVPFTEDLPPRPVDPYGLSKWEAEQALRRIAQATGIELVVVRPPLVYGPGVGANFLSLMRLIARGVPLPLGQVSNRRSLVYLDNLTDLLGRCALDARAANQAFLVADEECLSTPSLIRELARALGVKARLLPVPRTVLRLAGAFMYQSAVVDRLTESLEVDANKVRRVLSWQAPYSVQQGLEKTADWFRAQQHT